MDNENMNIDGKVVAQNVKKQVDGRTAARKAAEHRMAKKAALADVVLFFTVLVAGALSPWVYEQGVSMLVSSEDAEAGAHSWLQEMRLLPKTNAIECKSHRCSAWVQDVGVISLNCNSETCVQR